MTPQQEKKLREVRDGIQVLRNKLDNVMYYMSPLSENEQKKVRGCYELLCKANDKL